MPVNNMFSTGFGTGGAMSGNNVWNNGGSWSSQKTTNKAPTKQEKFPGLNAQQIANIEKVTSNLTGAEKNQEQQKLYQAMIQAIETENFNSNRMAVNNERFRNSLSKTDPRECNFDQSACRQSTLVDMVKSARNLKANTPEDTVMQMFMQEMNYKGIGMDKLNAYLDSGDESILYEAGLKGNMGGTKDLINQAGATTDKSWDEKNLREKGETVTNYTNLVGLGTEKIDEAAGKFADKWLDRGNSLSEIGTDSLKNKLDNMSKEEVAQYRKQYEELLKDKDWRVGRVQGDTLVEQLWNGIKGNISYDYSDEDFMKWLISQKANLGESLVGADNILKGESDPNVIQMFGNIPASALKTFTATVRGMSNPYDTMKGLYMLGKDVADNGFENSAIGQRYGSWDAFANAMNTDPVGVADDALAVAELGANIIGGGMKATGKLTGNTNLINKGSMVQGSIGSANDVLADRLLHGGDLTISKNFTQDWKNTDAGLINGGFKDGYNPNLQTVKTKGLYGVMDSTLGNQGALGTLNRALQDQSSLQKMTQEGGKAIDRVENSKLGQGFKNAWNDAINHLVGIDEADREFIRNNKDLVNDYLNGKKNTESLYNTVTEKLDDKILEKIETGEEYEKLYKNKKKIVNTEGITNDKTLLKKLKDAGVSVDADGNLVFEKINDFDSKQQKALQDAWETLKDVESEKKLNSRQTLGQRRKIDNKINWEGKPDKMTASDITTENLIKDMRRPLDARAKQYIPGLEELDAKYQPLIEEVRQLRKDWFNSDGTIKDSARSKVRNLTKAGNEAKLERLEKIAPGITQDLRALDVAGVVEKASKQGVGQYAKGNMLGNGAAGGGIVSLFATGHPILGGAALALWILSSPKNYVKLVEDYPDIAEKLSAGQELLPSDWDRLQAWASRLEDGMEE